MVDTGDLTVHGLRGLIQERYGRSEGDPGGDAAVVRLQARPAVEADIVLDVRFLPNPFFVEAAVAR